MILACNPAWESETGGNSKSPLSVQSLSQPGLHKTLAQNIKQKHTTNSQQLKVKATVESSQVVISETRLRGTDRIGCIVIGYLRVLSEPPFLASSALLTCGA